MSREHCEASQRSMGRHWTDFRPVLENPSASRRGLKLRRPRATGRTPAGTLMVGIQNLVYAARQLTGVRATFGNRVHLLGSRIQIDGEATGWMGADSAGLRKSERIAIGDQDCISHYMCGHGTTIHYRASQLPGSG